MFSVTPSANVYCPHVSPYDISGDFPMGILPIQYATAWGVGWQVRGVFDENGGFSLNIFVFQKVSVLWGLNFTYSTEHKDR